MIQKSIAKFIQLPDFSILANYRKYSFIYKNNLNEMSKYTNNITKLGYPSFKSDKNNNKIKRINSIKK